MAEHHQVDSSEPIFTLTKQPKVIIKDLNLLSLSGIVHIGKTIGLFLWFFLKSFCAKIYCRRKIIRNQFVLITGSGGFVGRQLACEFSKYGVSLILWDINEEENKKTYDALRKLGHRRMYLYKVDLTNETEVRETSKAVIEKHGFISTVVLAAATIGDVNSILFKSSENLTKTFDLFYLSHVWIYQEFLPKMIERNQGHLVLISSEAVFVNPPMTSTYACMKSAQTKLLECIEAELSSNEENKIKTSIVFLSLLKGGLATQIAQGLDIKHEFIHKMGISIEIAAQKILKKILENRRYIYISKRVYFIALMKYILPTACFDLLFSANNYIKLDLVSRSKKQD